MYTPIKKKKTGSVLYKVELIALKSYKGHSYKGHHCIHNWLCTTESSYLGMYSSAL